MKILIAGAAGFLGSHLVGRFLDEKFQVIGIDDLSTGSLSNLAEFQGNPDFNFLNHDIRAPIKLKVDVILNFACPASPFAYQADPIKTLETNFMGTLNLLNLTNLNRAIFLQASTSEVYGDPEISPQIESYWGKVNPIGIRACYDEGKRVAETLCFDFMRIYDLDARVIRIFNTYGPKMSKNDGRVVSNLVNQAIQNLPITLYGDGLQTRSFCYVSDLVDGIFKTVNLDKKLNSPINLGNPNEITMLHLAQVITTLTNSNSEISYQDLPSDDPRQRKPDIKKAQNILGWSPKVTLEQGLLKTIKFYDK